VIVFVRAPEPGRVKTRLAASIGAAAALAIYTRLAEATVREALALAAEGVQVRVHYTPADAEPHVRAWLGDGPLLLRQSDGDLGRRMRDAFDRAFADGHRQVLIIGSDLPEMSAGLLRRAFEQLDAHLAVIGPAHDGGYYLLGMTRLIDGVFDGIAWSTPEVLDATLARLRAAGVNAAILPTLRDVDEVDDLPPGWLEQARAG
jgi:rSAM/selenodomain-associated transferase 1